MFHHAHAYIATQIHKSTNPLLIMGSILPDAAVTKLFGWDDGLHGPEASQQFAVFIQKNYPDQLDLANGVHAHNLLDDLSHRQYQDHPGYAFWNNQKLVPLIAAQYELDPERAIGITHNYIESAVDILLLSEQPNFQTEFKNAIQNIDQKAIARILSDYFKVDASTTKTSLNEFCTLFTKYDFTLVDQWAVFWNDLESLLSLKISNSKNTQELLRASLDITKDTYKSFLSFASQAS